MEIMLVNVWAAVLAFAVFMYVLMDGFDLGVGILFPFAANDGHRDLMMNSVAPVWDGNETWLVLGGGGLLAAFPLAYATLLPAMYFPVLLMLIALIFRGVAFEFRFKAHTSRRLWDVAFHGGSVAATFAQGIVLGGFIQGFETQDGRFSGGAFDWLTAFSVFTGFALVAGYALLGATWLVMKTEGDLQRWARSHARRLVWLLIAAVIIVSLWTPWLDESIAARWFSWPNLLFFSPVPVLTALCMWQLVRALDRGAEYQPFIYALVLFWLSYSGFIISLWPHVIPPRVTIYEAAAAPEAQLFLLIGVGFLVPAILAYTAYTYWVFRGKVRPGEGYH
ncbi:cytochrome d ubiquinol oxidase subunit II [Arhodomonas sp. AD133]|uniref:cytochrome d ubiquinol oxidase subunit II n=1 Tax=Arhodomonas sp. AD133 TaxID=3415009 RepID=UPI003EBD6BC8